MDDLVTIEKITIPEVFKAKGLDPIIERIKKEVENFIPDITSLKGRAKIKALAFKITKSKTYIDEIGKEYTTRLKEIPKTVDAERKRMRDILDSLKDKVRAPLTEWENERSIIKEKERIAEEEIRDHEQALIDNKIFIKQKELENREKQIAEIERQQREKQEVERIEKERIERETALKIKAEAKAKQEAEEAKRQAQQDKEEAEEAKRQAEINRIETEKKVEVARLEAIIQAQKDKEEAIKIERERVEAEAKKIEAARVATEIRNRAIEAARVADFKNREAIENVISIDMEAQNFRSKSIPEMVECIKSGLIRNLTINY